MAKKVRAVKKPKIFKEPKKVGRKSINAMRSEILDNLQATAQRVDDVYIKRMPNYLQITEKKLEDNGIVDLKKAFAKSSKKRKTKGGGWYLIVPIRIKTSQMSKKTYQDMRSLYIPESGGQASTLTDYLQAIDKGRDIKHPSLIPQKPQDTMTKVRKKNKKQASYFVFRTISNKSPANAWVLNRDKATSERFSDTTMKNIRALMNWKMKNLR